MIETLPSLVQLDEGFFFVKLQKNIKKGKNTKAAKLASRIIIKKNSQKKKKRAKTQVAKQKAQNRGERLKKTNQCGYKETLQMLHKTMLWELDFILDRV